MRILLRFTAPLLLTAFLVGCVGAYAKAVQRGDSFAAAGDWAAAVAAYEEAVQLDPTDPEAKIKIKAVRKRQSAQYLSKATALEQRGELANALA
ncbi:MAG TPA: tetratricopeptide repeat protein, partial [Sorangium sp.]|nr:tetratricopeptide repeat protein [Sorangium sp.]